MQGDYGVGQSAEVQGLSPVARTTRSMSRASQAVQYRSRTSSARPRQELETLARARRDRGRPGCCASVRSALTSAGIPSQRAHHVLDDGPAGKGKDRLGGKPRGAEPDLDEDRPVRTSDALPALDEVPRIPAEPEPVSCAPSRARHGTPSPRRKGPVSEWSM